MILPRPVPQGAPIVRQAAIRDVPAIHELLYHHSQQGNLLPRSMSEIYRSIRDFSVIAIDDEPIACGALEIFTDDLCEIRSLVVGPDHERRGYGALLVEDLVRQARELGLTRVMALTYAAGFFHRLGFVTVAKDTLPEKVWGVCVKCYKFNHCDETAVLKVLR
jgi:amino-acid N-acetyltransferase